MSTEKAIKKSGGVMRLSRALGVHYQDVQKWRRRGRVPERYILAIEEISGVPRDLFRPELFEGYQRIAPLPQPQAMGAEAQTSEELRPC